MTLKEEVMKLSGEILTESPVIYSNEKKARIDYYTNNSPSEEDFEMFYYDCLMDYKSKPKEKKVNSYADTSDWSDKSAKFKETLKKNFGENTVLKFNKWLKTFKP